MRHFLTILAVQIGLASAVLADVAPEPHDRPALHDSQRVAGTWRRFDAGSEKDSLVISKAGEVRVHENGRQGIGRCRAVSADKIEVVIRTTFADRRLVCRWQREGNELTLEVVDSESRSDPNDIYRQLDEDRSLIGQTWLYRR